MIPVFPEFKPLELSDRSEIDAVACLFQPYSDFNFTNMYAWDTQGAMCLSRLHGNIVVQFIDYLSEAVFLTFIGHQRIAETAGALLSMAKEQFKAAVLRFIPEEVAQTLAAHGFAVTQDHGASDYVYAVDHLAGMHRWAGRRSRSRIRQFAARYPDYSIRHQPLALIDPAEYRALFMTWARRKNGAAPHVSNEYRAFERFLHMPAEIEVVALYANAGLVGFSSFELMRHDTAIVHFSKAPACAPSLPLFHLLPPQTYPAVRIEIKPSIILPGEIGVFATRRFSKDTVIVPIERLADVRLLESPVFDTLDALTKRKLMGYCVGTPEGLLVPADLNYISAAWQMNHSCQPNVGFNAADDFVAMRAIKRTRNCAGIMPSAKAIRSSGCAAVVAQRIVVGW